MRDPAEIEAERKSVLNSNFTIDGKGHLYRATSAEMSGTAVVDFSKMHNFTLNQDTSPEAGCRPFDAQEEISYLKNRIKVIEYYFITNPRVESLDGHVVELRSRVAKLENRKCSCGGSKAGHDDGCALAAPTSAWRFIRDEPLPRDRWFLMCEQNLISPPHITKWFDDGAHGFWVTSSSVPYSITPYTQWAELPK